MKNVLSSLLHRKGIVRKRIRFVYRMTTFCILLLGFSLLTMPVVSAANLQIFYRKQPDFHLHRLLPKQIVIGSHETNGMSMATDLTQQSWPKLISKAAVLIDLRTGTVLYAKNPMVRHYPASLTKILTALLALQTTPLSDEISISAKAAAEPPDKLYQLPGETHSLKKLLYAMLLDSDNDVAEEIAQDLAGSQAAFADWMNSAAIQLGAYHSHFVNPSGLPNTEQYTTAYDMSRISYAAMQVPEFRKMVDTKSIYWNGEAWHAKLTNINPLLFSYPGAIGVKTGYTSEAHETLVVAAKRGQQEFLAVLLDCPLNSEIVTDATQLLNAAFARATSIILLPSHYIVGYLVDPLGTRVPLQLTEQVAAVLPLGGHERIQSIHWHVDNLRSRKVLPSGTQIGMASIRVTGAENETLRVPIVLAAKWQGKQHARTSNWGSVVILAFIFVGVVLFVKRRQRSRRNRSY